MTGLRMVWNMLDARDLVGARKRITPIIGPKGNLESSDSNVSIEAAARRKGFNDGVYVGQPPGIHGN